jgi:TolB-like protein
MAMGAVKKAAGQLLPALPEPSAIRAQLERIIASDEFCVSERNRRFLSYIVNEALAGRASGLKAYSIATEVFERRETFDAQNDPVVRIEARILRRALERYYLVAGVADPILIGIPKGGYRPTFTLGSRSPLAERIVRSSLALGRPRWRRWAMAAATAVLLVGVACWTPGLSPAKIPLPGAPVWTPAEGSNLLIAPFISLGDEAEAQFFAEGLTGEITARLANLKGFTVVGQDSPDHGGPSHLQQNLRVRFALDGVVHALDDRLYVSARLLDLETGFILWSETYSEDIRAHDVLAVKQDVVEKLATAVSEFGGVVLGTDRR